MAWSYTKNSDDQFYYEVACRVDDIILSELVGEMPSNEELKRMYTFSEEFEQKMSALIDSIGQRRIIPNSIKRIIIIAAAIVALIVGALNAGAIWKSLYDLYLTCFEDHTVATYQDISDSDLSDGSDFVAENDVAVDITEYYEPSYIPEGYEEIKRENDDISKFVVFSNGHDNIIFSQSTLALSIQLDTEDSPAVYVAVGSIECHYIKNNEYITLVFEKDGYVFTVEGLISESEAIKMAQSIISE